MQKLVNPELASVPDWQVDAARPGFGQPLQQFTAGIDRLAFVLAAVGMVAALFLIGVMTYEVVVRRVFNSPTLWAYDISYMLNGTLVFLGGAYTLVKNEHVRIDFLSSQLPQQVQDLINVAFYLFLLLPILGALTYTAFAEALRAYLSGAVEAASTWGPLSWPFFTTLSIGLAGVLLQGVVQMLRHAQAALNRGPSPLVRPDEGVAG